MTSWLPGLARCACLLLLPCLLALGANAADFPKPREGHWVARDFRFESGETLPELRLAYTTVGDPAGEPVLILHGTTGSAASLLTPDFAGELFGPGQPLDAAKHFIILPDAIGTGASSKPSDGLRTAFPRYNYNDMVAAQYRLLAGMLVKGGGFGLIGDLVVGVLGAVFGGFMFSTFGVSSGGGLVGSLFVATAGAVVLLIIVRLVKRA